jgi:hypothetical protein
MNNKTTHYVICLDNSNYPASLEVRKLYPVIQDSEAEEHHLIRIIDESGEDYLYPAENFAYLKLSQQIIDQLSSKSKS